MTPLKVVLADDHPAIINGLRSDLSQEPYIHVIESPVGSSTELIDVLNQKDCDVVVTDYSMPGGEYGDGLTLIGFLRRRYPNLIVVVYTALDNPAVVNELLRLGVHAVLNKIEPPQQVVETLHTLLRKGGTGKRVIHESGKRVRSPRQTPTADTPALTQREIDVVRLFAEGWTINQIAQQMNRTKQTISAQKISAKRKLNIKRDADLIRYLYEAGFTVLNDGANQSVLERS